MAINVVEYLEHVYIDFWNDPIGNPIFSVRSANKQCTSI